MLQTLQKLKGVMLLFLCRVLISDYSLVRTWPFNWQLYSKRFSYLKWEQLPIFMFYHKERRQWVVMTKHVT